MTDEKLCYCCLVEDIMTTSIIIQPRHEKTCILYEKKDANQLCGSLKADQHLCFGYTDSIIPLLH